MPDANLGIVMSASRTRRQMIQRMGRILRRKQRRGRGPVRDHVRQGHAGGSGAARRARRLPRRDRAHLRRHRRLRRPPLRRARRVPRRARPRDRARARAPTTERATRGSSRSSPRIVAPVPRRRRAECTGRVTAPNHWTEPDSPYLELDAVQPARDRQAQGGAEAPVDRSGAARDRAGRVGWRITLHRLWRGPRRWSSSGGRSSTRRSTAAATEPAKVQPVKAQPVKCGVTTTAGVTVGGPGGGGVGVGVHGCAMANPSTFTLSRVRRR